MRSHRIIPDIDHWLDLSNLLSRPIAAKSILLVITAAFAVDARLRVIPRLSADKLASLARHVYPVALASVLFVSVGVSFRIGWLS